MSVFGFLFEILYTGVTKLGQGHRSTVHAYILKVGKRSGFYFQHFFFWKDMIPVVHFHFNGTNASCTNCCEVLKSGTAVTTNKLMKCEFEVQLLGAIIVSGEWTAVPHRLAAPSWHP